MSGPIIEVDSLKREYVTRDFFRRVKKRTQAVDGISFSVNSGELFGMIGPNGAGKTTTIKMLSTLLTPTSGTAKVLGFDVTRDIYEIRKRIGIVFGGDRGLYNRVTAIDNLRYFSDLYGVPTSISKKRVYDLIEMVGLSGRENEKVEKYSRGMKQRLHIAKALVNDPELIFLDEPTIGLDPAGARSIRKMIRALENEGKTILLTSHYMFEVDELCKRIGVISKGKIVAIDHPSALKKIVKDVSLLEVQCYGLSEGFLKKVEALDGVGKVFTDSVGDRSIVKIQTERGVDLAQYVKEAASSDGIRILEISLKEPTLEDAYLRMVEE